MGSVQMDYQRALMALAALSLRWHDFEGDLWHLELATAFLVPLCGLLQDASDPPPVPLSLARVGALQHAVREYAVLYSCQVKRLSLAPRLQAQWQTKELSGS